MTKIGSGLVYASNKSSVPVSGKSAISSRAKARMRGSSAATRRGVKARCTALRRRVCRGRSWVISMGLAGTKPLGTVPRADDQVAGSRTAAWTSA